MKRSTQCSRLRCELRAGDKDGLNLSHWLAYEDRETGEIRIPMRRWSADYTKFQGVEYTIAVAKP